MSLNIKDRELLGIVDNAEEPVGYKAAQKNCRFGLRSVKAGFLDLHERGYLEQELGKQGVHLYTLSKAGEQAV